MTLNLDDYRACFAKMPPELLDTIEPTFHEAARVMSPAGLSDYMEGARGLCNLGRGHDLVLAYLENMPAVVKECGEDVIRDCVGAAMKLSSMTSGEVIALLFSSLPTAARRLGDPELLRGYLALIHQLSAKAARGLRPMLAHIDELLSKLTLSGLRRWANFGAEAYRRDLPNLVRYFALESPDARKMLQQERRGTLFIDAQRKLNFYLRALWGRDFFLRPTAADYEGFRPYVEHHVMHLPDALDDIADIPGFDLYRAMVAHQAAHIQYTTAPVSAEQLSPAQMFFIGLIEDARVEWCAAQDFPGLAKLWNRLLAVEHKGQLEHPTVEALERVGKPVFPRGRRGLADLLRFLKSGGMTALLVDLHVKRGETLSFFGQPAKTALSAAELALKFDAPLVPAYAIRQPDGLSFEIVIEAPVPPGDPADMMQAVNDSIEAMARRHMEQWFWIHRRWKV